MSETEIYSVVDVGNSQVNIVDFVAGKIQSLLSFPTTEKTKLLSALNQRIENKSILSSVLGKGDSALIRKELQPDVFLTSDISLPIQLSQYQTSRTLGADRIANAVAAHYYKKTQNALVVDLGTCIKFDLVVDGSFLGGAISPGYQMRFKAMHTFTGALPLLTPQKNHPFLGFDTSSCMISGVMNGIQAEIVSFIAQYEKKYKGLTIFLTGGDLEKFDIPTKNSIFVDKNLTVKGLYLILKHNV